MKSINLLGKPAPSFDEPIEMLKACHERIAAQCLTLEKLVDYLPVHGADTQARQAAANILRYFDEAGPNHQADEEHDLFPMLIEACRRQASPVPERIASLHMEHRSLDAAWAQVRVVLTDIVQGKADSFERGLVENFVGAYRAHIAEEESEVFPFAEASLDREQLAKLGAAMVARRTYTPQ